MCFLCTTRVNCGYFVYFKQVSEFLFLCVCESVSFWKCLMENVSVLVI